MAVNTKQFPERRRIYQKRWGGWKYYEWNMWATEKILSKKIFIFKIKKKTHGNSGIHKKERVLGEMNTHGAY